MFFRNEELVSVDVAQTWEVRWWSRYNGFSHGTQGEVSVFVSEETANRFAQALRDAFKLIKHTSGTAVTVKKSDIQ